MEETNNKLRLELYNLIEALEGQLNKIRNEKAKVRENFGTKLVEDDEEL